MLRCEDIINENMSQIFSLAKFAAKKDIDVKMSKKKHT